jgi:flagellar biosynthesis chaperone FliJ
MKDIKQVKLITKALEKEKEKYVFEFGIAITAIERKKVLINQMIVYLKEYAVDGKLDLSRSIPALHKNLVLFSQQIEDVISKTEVEMDKLSKSKEIIAKKIEKVDQKITLMNNFEEQIKKANFEKSEKLEQSTLDDLSSIKHLRGPYA